MTCVGFSKKYRAGCEAGRAITFSPCLASCGEVLRTQFGGPVNEV